MSSKQPLAELRAQAVALRRAGRSRREIRDLLQVRSNATLNDLLRGEPPPLAVRRPNAKDELKVRARQMRAEGMDYEQIAAGLQVSKSSVSLWVRDIPRPERLSRAECDRRRDEAVASYWARERPRRDAAREAARTNAGLAVGPLTDREVLIAGAIAYWCEGSKSKPYRPSGRVNFINSDPGLIRLYLRFLRAAGVSQEQLAFRVSIHESADVTGAHAFWLTVTRADPGQFRSPNLKKHNPATVRANTGDSYHGCLRVDVLRAGDLYQRIEGWWQAITRDTNDPPDSSAIDKLDK